MTEQTEVKDETEPTTKALATSGRGGALLEPVATPEKVIAAQTELRNLIEKALKKDRDYGTIPGTNKPTLYQPGAERINAAFGVATRFQILEKEVDHFVEVSWTKRKKKYEQRKFVGWEEQSGTSQGIYRYVVRCELVLRSSGEVIGQGLGSCSTLEGKYVERPREYENTMLKMAEKRAFVGVTKMTYGLSDQFTQDVEDMDVDFTINEGRGEGAKKEQLPVCPKCGGPMWDNREKKKSGEFNPKSPDLACKDKTCKGVIWHWPPADAATPPANAASDAIAPTWAKIKEAFGILGWDDGYAKNYVNKWAKEHFNVVAKGLTNDQLEELFADLNAQIDEKASADAQDDKKGDDVPF